MVPLDSSLEIAVDLTPRLHPEPLVDVCLGVVVAIVASEESLDADGMPEGEHRCVEIDLQSALLGIDERLARGIAELGMELRRAELVGAWSRNTFYIIKCGVSQFTKRSEVKTSPPSSVNVARAFVRDKGWISQSVQPKLCCTTL